MKHLIVLLLAALYSSQALAIELSFEEESTLPLVQLALVYKNGSITDPNEKLGLTNITGELLMRGTKTRTREKFDEEIDRLGAKIDVETRVEAQIVRVAVLSRKLPEFLEIMTDVLTGPGFSADELKKLKSEITAGILEETSRDPMLAARRFSEFFFSGHPYGRPIWERFLRLRKSALRMSRAIIKITSERPSADRRNRRR